MNGNKAPNTMETKWGKVSFHYSNSGKPYYRTYRNNKKYPNKYLHRLIFEDFYGWIPDGYHVHHIDGNSLNNCILNLKLIRNGEHSKLHNAGQSNGMFGRCGMKHHNNKYSLWDSGKAVYDSGDHNRNKPFRCNYKGYRLPIGMFCEWISCEIINNLIDDALDEECDI